MNFKDHPEFEPVELFKLWEERKNDPRWTRESTINRSSVMSFDTAEGSSTYAQFEERNTGNVPACVTAK